LPVAVDVEPDEAMEPRAGVRVDQPMVDADGYAGCRPFDRVVRAQDHLNACLRRLTGVCAVGCEGWTGANYRDCDRRDRSQDTTSNSHYVLLG
jgi:hypothetical protein